MRTGIWPGLSATALLRVRRLLAERDLGALALTTPGGVGWATRGLNVPIDRVAGVDTVWVVVMPDSACLVTTGVEAPRIASDYLAEGSLELVSVPWWEPGALADAVAAWTGLSPAAIGSDGHSAFGHDLTDDLVDLRLSLDDTEAAMLRRLGRDATSAVEDALRAWQPGECDTQIAARIASAVELCGAQAPVLLVGGDDRLARFRHPVSVGEPLRYRVMAVLVASRGAQHVALTRYATAAPDAELVAMLSQVQQIHRTTLAKCVPGAATGDILTALASGYRDQGHPDAWRDHYQGGPIGYAQREFEIAPGQTTSRWWSAKLPANCAVAWNPSLAGGAKDEDTFLVGPQRLEAITTSTDWPTIDDQLPARPAPLVVGH